MDWLYSVWTHNLSPFLWQFPESWGNWGPGGIRWYGISYLAGFLSAYYLLYYYFKKNRSPYDSDQIINLMTFQVMGVLLGGRVGFVLLYRTEEFFDNPLMILFVWQGGMASHGGFAGVILATIWYAKKSHQNFWPVADLIATVVPPGLFFGRLANFINGELWGKQTDSSWGVLFPNAPDFALGVARHPSQLYAAFLEGLFIFAYVQLRFWRSDIYVKNPGRLGGEFLIAYAISRIIGEFYREPDASLIIGISRGQFYSIFLLLGGIGVIFYSLKRKKI